MSAECDRAAATERFWSRVDKSGGPTACWPWTGYVSPAGRPYARYGLGRGKRGGSTRTVAYRIAYALSVGIDPLDQEAMKAIEGRVIRHNCDNPVCCNPHCLLAGTQAENMADMHSRGRAVGVKLEPSEVLTIRWLHSRGPGAPPVDWTHTALAQMFKVARQTIGDIIERRTWAHLSDTLEEV